MLGRSKLTIIFIYFLYLSSLILFLSVLTIFLILTTMNINLFPLFLNTNKAIKIQIFLIFYSTIICLTCYFCFIYTKTINSFLYELAINKYIIFGLISICSLMITYFLDILILRNENVIFRVFNKELVEKKLDCCFDNMCDKSCYDILRFLYNGVFKRMFYGNLIIFIFISINLALGSLLLIKEDSNYMNSEFNSIRNRNNNNIEGGFHIKKSNNL